MIVLHPPAFATAEDAASASPVGRVRTVRCDHIQQMMGSAAWLVDRVNGRVFPEPCEGGEVPSVDETLRCLERAINLLTHAAAELQDERLKLRDGWTG